MFKEQIRKAVISVSSNIAEGFERGSKKEFTRFLYIAKGSAGEVRSQLIIGYELNYINKEEFEKLTEMTINLSKQLGAFISNLKMRY